MFRTKVTYCDESFDFYFEQLHQVPILDGSKWIVVFRAEQEGVPRFTYEISGEGIFPYVLGEDSIVELINSDPKLSLES